MSPTEEDCKIGLQASTLQDEALIKAQQRLQLIQYAEHQRQQSKTSSNCAICQKLLRFFFSEESETVLGSRDEINKLSCDNHQGLCGSYFDPGGNDQIRLRKSDDRRLFYVLPSVAEHSAQLDAPWESYRIGVERPLLDLDLPQARMIDHQWIDLELLQSWWSRCLNQHASICGRVDEESPVRRMPRHVIDVDRGCIIDTKDHELNLLSYVALSYVWGGVECGILRKDNIDMLKTPGELLRGDRLATIPRTITQSIRLAQKLGQRYLWIDALCILQDDPDEKMLEIDAMGDIFSKAVFTIVCAQGDNADVGFAGLYGISDQRTAAQRHMALSSSLQLLKPICKQVWDNSVLHPWSSRGWTFQEQLCSRRILYFAHDTVRWVCSQACWSEESESDDCMQAYASAEQQQIALESPTISNSTLPDMSEYTALVNVYNARQFTFIGDIDKAFRSIASRLAIKFQSRFIAGMPVDYLDLFLLWRPQRRLGPAKRRHAGHAQISPPTWSWLGWETEISFPYTFQNQELDMDALPVILGSRMPFFMLRRITLLPNTVTALPWHSFLVGMPTDGLPSGWSRRKVSGSRHSDDGLEDLVVYEHDQNPGLEYWFPITHPFYSKQDFTGFPQGIQTLRVEAPLAMFKLGEARYACTRIYTLDDKPAGTLWHHDEFHTNYLQATQGPLAQRQPIMMIAVLGCTTAVSDIDLWRSTDNTTSFLVHDEASPKRTKEVYNVLWITISDCGMAERQASGEVERELWEASNPLMSTVMLG